MGSFSRFASMPLIAPDSDQDDQEDSEDERPDVTAVGRATTHSSFLKKPLTKTDASWKEFGVSSCSVSSSCTTDGLPIGSEIEEAKQTFMTANTAVFSGTALCLFVCHEMQRLDGWVLRPTETWGGICVRSLGRDALSSWPTSYFPQFGASFAAARPESRRAASTQVGCADPQAPAWAQPLVVGQRHSRSAAFSGFRDRMRCTLGVNVREKNRSRLVLKATDARSEVLRSEDLKRLLAEVYDSKDTRWVLQRLQEQPVQNNTMVAFKTLVVLHRILQCSPPQAADLTRSSALLESIVAAWSQAASDGHGTQACHGIQVVIDYAQMLQNKLELMNKDSGCGYFTGNFCFSRSMAEPCDLLQALALLLSLAEKLMPLVLELTQEQDWISPEQSPFGRLYLGAVPTLLDEAWQLLCAVSVFVRDLLWQVHAAAKFLCTREETRQRQIPGPPWLELAMHLLQAQPRFVRFHSSMCDFVALCHQLRCAGYAELAPPYSIPAVPQALLNLFADFEELVKGHCAERGTPLPEAPKPTKIASSRSSSKSSEASKATGSTDNISTVSTAAGSTVAPETGGSTWYPSARVMDALRTVDSRASSGPDPGFLPQNASHCVCVLPSPLLAEEESPGEDPKDHGYALLDSSSGEQPALVQEKLHTPAEPSGEVAEAAPGQCDGAGPTTPLLKASLVFEDPKLPSWAAAICRPRDQWDQVRVHYTGIGKDEGAWPRPFRDWLAWVKGEKGIMEFKPTVDFLKILSSPNTSLQYYLQTIIAEVIRVLNADRCSIFFVDDMRKEVWCVGSLDMEPFCQPWDKGIVGMVATEGKMVNLADAHDHPAFDGEIEKKTGYTVKGILSLPVKSVLNLDKAIGVIQVLNKRSSSKGEFSEQDAVELQKLASLTRIAESLIVASVHQLSPVIVLRRASGCREQLLQLLCTRMVIGDSFYRQRYKALEEVTGHFDSEVQAVLDQHRERTAKLCMLCVLKEELPAHAQVEDLASLNFDVLEQAEIFLQELVPDILRHAGCIDNCSIPEKQLMAYPEAVFRGYRSFGKNPFHNAYHGFAVYQMCFHQLSTIDTFSQLTATQGFGLLVAALCHDIDHPGVTNSYLIRLQDDLALRYNDNSVLENHHASVACTLLRDERTAIGSGLAKEEQVVFRKTIIKCILATDMAHHQSCCQRLIGCHSTEDFKATAEEDPQFLMSVCVHAADPWLQVQYPRDLSAQALDWEVAKKWEERICQEFREQAAKEVEMGFTPEPFMQFKMEDWAVVAQSVDAVIAALQWKPGAQAKLWYFFVSGHEATGQVAAGFRRLRFTAALGSSASVHFDRPHIKGIHQFDVMVRPFLPCLLKPCRLEPSLDPCLSNLIKNRTLYEVRRIYGSDQMDSMAESDLDLLLPGMPRRDAPPQLTPRTADILPEEGCILGLTPCTCEYRIGSVAEVLVYRAGRSKKEKLSDIDAATRRHGEPCTAKGATPLFAAPLWESKRVEASPPPRPKERRRPEQLHSGRVTAGKLITGAGSSTHPGCARSFQPLRPVSRGAEASYDPTCQRRHSDVLASVGHTSNSRPPIPTTSASRTQPRGRGTAQPGNSSKCGAAV
eukprot:s202_g26.t1